MTNKNGNKSALRRWLTGAETTSKRKSSPAGESNLQFSGDPDMDRAKAWWNEHGRSIVGGVVIGLSAVVGFNYWQNYQQTQAGDASILFEQLREEIESATETEAETESEAETDAEADAETETENEADAETDTETEADADAETETTTNTSIETIADELMSGYASTPYATHAAFTLAKFAVESGDLDKAARALEWVLDNADEDGLLHIARLRLASVLLSKGETDSVVTLLQVQDTAGFTARYHELRGDAHFQKGDTAGARSAYQSSIDRLSPNSAERSLLKLKLDNLGG